MESLREFNDDAALDPKESAQTLIKICWQFIEMIDGEAKAIPSTGLIEAKILLARHIEQDVQIVTQLDKRVRELGQSMDLAALRAAIKGQAQDLVMRSENPHFLPYDTYDLRRATLANILEVRNRIHPLWDEPTARIIELVDTCLTEQLQQFEAVTRVAATTAPGVNSDSSRPRRDGRLTVVADSRLQLNSDSGERNLAELMHHTLMGTEIPTIEMTAALIRDFPDTPWEFVRDISRQLWDEARHAEMCIRRLRQSGFEIGDFPCDHKTWSLTNGRPLELRLAIHQRIGEWLGVDAAIEWTRRMESSRDLRTAGLLNFIVEDEISHVAIGNRWLNVFCGSEEKVWAVHEVAEDVRAKASGQVNGHIPLPLNVESCVRSGFGKLEIEKLALNRDIVGDNRGDPQ